MLLTKDCNVLNSLIEDCSTNIMHQISSAFLEAVDGMQASFRQEAYDSPVLENIKFFVITIPPRASLTQPPRKSATGSAWMPTS